MERGERRDGFIGWVGGWYRALRPTRTLPFYFIIANDEIFHGFSISIAIRTQRVTTIPNDIHWFTFQQIQNLSIQRWRRRRRRHSHSLLAITPRITSPSTRGNPSSQLERIQESNDRSIPDRVQQEGSDGRWGMGG